MKTQILVVTHGKLAHELVRLVSDLKHEQRPLTALGLEDASTPEAFEGLLKDTLLSFAPEDKVVILTDLFGGTPSNLSIPYVQKDKIEVITGVNLAILMQLLNQSAQSTFEELCHNAKNAGLKSIFLAGEFL